MTIRPFQPIDQTAVRRLILDGLAEHWGQLDPDKNHDLDDIAATYGRAHFLVACVAGEIVGSGALVLEGAQTGRIVRMSVNSAWRQRGIGRALCRRLCQAARRAGCRRIVLETTASWTGAIAFYQRCGFRLMYVRDGDAHFERDLTP